MWRGLVLGVFLTGCAGGDGGRWPTLAPRANEVSPLVPRVPLGACAGCDSGPAPAMSAPPALLGMPELPPLPGDVNARLAAIAAGIAEVEGHLPAARDEARVAQIRAAQIRAAQTGAFADEETRASEADVQASRFEVLFLGLGELDGELALIEDGLAVRPEMAALMAEAAALRARLEALEAVRTAGL